MDDAGLAIDAGAFHDVIVELVALLLGDERGHNRVIQGYMDSAAGSIEMRHLAIEMFYIG